MPRSVLAQSWVAVGTGAAALAATTVLWVLVPLALAPVAWAGEGLLAAGLIAGVVLAYRFPIHIHYRLKIEMSTVPIYLLSVLLPPPLAVLGAGAGMLLA